MVNFMASNAVSKHYFGYIAAVSAHVNTFHVFYVPVLCTMFFQSCRLLFDINMKIMISADKGINLVTMTFINPRSEVSRAECSNQRPSVLKFCRLPTLLPMLELDVNKIRASLPLLTAIPAFFFLSQFLKSFLFKVVAWKEFFPKHG